MNALTDWFEFRFSTNVPPSSSLNWEMIMTISLQFMTPLPCSFRQVRLPMPFTRVKVNPVGVMKPGCDTTSTGLSYALHTLKTILSMKDRMDTSGPHVEKTSLLFLDVELILTMAGNNLSWQLFWWSFHPCSFWLHLLKVTIASLKRKG